SDRCSSCSWAPCRSPWASWSSTWSKSCCCPSSPGRPLFTGGVPLPCGATACDPVCSAACPVAPVDPAPVDPADGGPWSPAPGVSTSLCWKDQPLDAASSSRPADGAPWGSADGFSCDALRVPNQRNNPFPPCKEPERVVSSASFSMIDVSYTK